MKLNRIWILILVIVTGLFVSTLRIPKVCAITTITIKSDGNIDPPSAPIVTYDNVTYTLTENITSDAGVTGIVIERDYITLDGAGFTLQGAHAGQIVSGVFLNSVTGVTVRNLRVVFYRYGISVNGGTFNMVWGNTLVANTEFGINVGGSNHTIYGNTVNAANETGYVFGQKGIHLFASKYNNVTGNTVTGHLLYGIFLNWWDTQLASSSNNILRNNVMTGNRYNFCVETGIPADYVNDVDESNTVDGKPMCYWVNQHDKTVPIDAGYVALVQCSGITVRDLVLSKNQRAIMLISTSSSTVTNCNISQSYYAIYCGWSSGITMSGNHIVVDYTGVSIRESPHCTISQSTVAFDEEKADEFTLYGLNLAYCSNLTISENTILHDYSSYQPRLFFYGCSNDTIKLNIIENVKMFFQDAANMLIFRNNFMWTDFQFSGTNTLLSWNDGYPSGGNYWDDWSATDVFQGPGQNETGSDGIWDGSRGVPSSGFVDNYPLVCPTRPVPKEFYAGYGRSADVTTSSRVTAFSFNASGSAPYVKFNVTGLDGTLGSCDVVFPNDMLWGTFAVYLDGVLLTEGVDYAKSENTSHWTFRVNYTHSTHTIMIEGTEAIPEFTVATITLVIMMTATFAATALARIRKRALSKALASM